MKTIRRSFVKFYRNLHLQSKLTITHLVLVVLPMLVLGIFFYTSMYGMIVSDTIRKEQSASIQTAPLIEETVNEILEVHRSITDLEFYRIITGSYTSDSLEDTLSASAVQNFNTTVEQLKSSSLITDVRFYLDIPRNESIVAGDTPYPALLPLDNAKGTYWYGIFEGSPATSSLFCPSFYLSPHEISEYGNMAYISESTMMYEGKITSCYLAIYFSNEHLTELLKNNLNSDNNVAYIINARDSLVASSNSSLSSIYHFDYDVVEDSFMSSNNFITKNVLGEEVYAGFYRIKNTDWYMVVAMPSTPLIQKSILLILGFILIYAACIIAAFLIATLLSHSITNRLSLVINQMALSRIGPPVALPEPETQDEIGDLIDTYNYLSRVINQLMDRQAQAAEDLRVAEFNSLQSQINPHFLYNTMDMINWLSQQGRVSEVTTAIQKLSRFYKLTLSRKKSLSTIADELEHVSIYVQLQNMRFHDTIDFLIDIPDVLMEYTIPKLTFQPVVENSILHGILEKEDKQGTIVLTGWMENNTIVLLISDDGVGIPPEKLSSILTGNGNSSRTSGTNIAVYNTHRRLQVLYGPDYGLTYSSTPGEGTEVEIRIPARLPEEIKDSTRIDTPYSTLRESHFIQALHLLSRPDITIQEVAKECGYESLQEFLRDFEQRFGYSPEEYRTHVL